MLLSITIAVASRWNQTEPAINGSGEETVAAPSGLLAVGVGYESVRSDDVDWQHVRQRMDAAGVDAVNISVGRVDFIAYPAAGKEDDWAPSVDEDRDRVEEIIHTLTNGTHRRVGLTVDVLAPRVVGSDDAYQGVFADGEVADDFPSAFALREGELGNRIEDLCSDATERYSPDYIVLTELIGDAFFSDADEDLYREMTGESGFPRADDGSVRIADDTLNAWQSSIITGVIERCQEAAGIPVEMDARVDFDHPGENRFESGHRYEDILDTGAHLALWAYTGLEGESPDAIGDIVAALRNRFTPEEMERITITVGLWDNDRPADARTSILAGDGTNMSITPLSMITEQHWDMLDELYNGNLE